MNVPEPDTVKAPSTVNEPTVALERISTLFLVNPTFDKFIGLRIFILEFVVKLLIKSAWTVFVSVLIICCKLTTEFDKAVVLFVPDIFAFIFCNGTIFTIYSDIFCILMFPTLNSLDLLG